MNFKIIFLVGSSLFFSSCLVGDTKCCDHVATDSISKGLYVERYRTFCAGVFGESTACYITDSINFRKKIGFYDEHESFFTKLNGDKLEVYNFQSLSIPDTVERKIIPKAQLLGYHHSDKNCLITSPIFGENTITCQTDFYPAGGYKNDDGYYISEVQYKCGNDYSNAVYYTDSVNFCVLVGIRNQANWGDNFSIKAINNGFEFYNIKYNNKIDTVKSNTFLLSDLRKGKLITVCN